MEGMPGALFVQRTVFIPDDNNNNNHDNMNIDGNQINTSSSSTSKIELIRKKKKAISSRAPRIPSLTERKKKPESKKSLRPRLLPVRAY
jgi:hypothetical protein